MANESHIQELVHRLEQGRWVPYVKFAAIAALLALLYAMFIFDLRDWYSFAGLTHEKGMEQAQISRNLARGHGYTTSTLKPLILASYDQSKGSYPPLGRVPDAYHSPLNPAVNAAVIKVLNGLNGIFEKTPALEWLSFKTTMDRRTIVYAYDRIIAGVSLGFLVLAFWVNYLVARRLFDSRLATLGILLAIGSARLWHYGATGLPQDLMVLIFSCGLYCLIRAVEIRDANEEREADAAGAGLIATGDPAEAPEPQPEEPPVAPSKIGIFPWLGGFALALGLLALAHGAALWLVPGAALYCFAAFRPRWVAAGLILAVVAAAYAPWAARNVKVTGSPFGHAPLAFYEGLRGPENEYMRSQDLKFTKNPLHFRAKLQNGLASQWNNIYEHLGSVAVAPAFFLALLHLFKRRSTASIRWAVLFMWLGALVGHAVLGVPDVAFQLPSTDLHLLFVPVMTFYGLAFVLVLWQRLNIRYRLVTYGCMVALLVASALPTLNLLLQKRSRIQWPPYAPPYIALLAEWTAPDEMIVTDMPWAVGWYAERVALWLPSTVKEFLEMNDRRMEGRVVGLYLTPVSVNAPFMASILKGAYQEWAPFILRTPQLRDFPFKAVTALPIDNECVFYADRARWQQTNE